MVIVPRDLSRAGLGRLDSPGISGWSESLIAPRTLNNVKIQPLDLILRDRETAFRPGLIQRCFHLFQIDFFVIGTSASRSKVG